MSPHSYTEPFADAPGTVFPPEPPQVPNPLPDEVVRWLTGEEMEEDSDEPRCWDYPADYEPEWER